MPQSVDTSARSGGHADTDPLTGTCAESGIGKVAPPTSHARNSTPVAPDTAAKAKVSTITYVEFAAAVRSALRNLHSPDLLARNPLLHNWIGNLDGSAGPSELRALLSEVVGTLFGNPRDEKLRRIIELTYFQPAPKQEAVAERLSLSFGTYRRYLATARDRLARWRWDNWQAASSWMLVTASQRCSGTATEPPTCILENT